jgi:hypothetical protein
MKKAILLCLLALTPFFGKAQFLNGFGINGGLTMAKHLWKVNDKNTDPPAFYANDGQNWKYGFNAAVFLEFFHSDFVRWQSEIQYNQKGGVEVAKWDNNKKFSTSTPHLCWNNYLKFRYELYAGTPYILAGVRLEYMLSQKSAALPVIGNFNKFEITPAIGAGWEFVTYGNIKPFIEVIYNPTLQMGPASYHVTDLAIYNRALEARVGFRYELARKETCPTVYK